MAERQQMLTVGRISGVYGVRGWLRVWSYSKPREEILDYGGWHIGGERGGWKPVEVLEGRSHGKGLVVRLEGVAEREQAHSLIGLDIAVPRSVLPTLPAGEYYWTDLEGLRVENLQGEHLGTVDYLFETGANDVMVVKGADRERLIPFVQGQVVTRVDLEEGLLQVDWEADF